MQTFTLQLGFWLVQYMRNATITFITRPKHKHFVIFPGKKGIKCVNYLKIISTSKNLTSATENKTTKNY